MTLRLRRDRTKLPRRLSPAQEAANQRSFRIFRLRGLWAHACLLTGERRLAMEALIDAELVALGAEPETARRARIDAEQDARWRAEGGPDLRNEIPF